MILRVLLLLGICWHVYGVRLDVMTAACAINPRLSFCDSHLFGKDNAEFKEIFDEDTGTSKPAITTSEPTQSRKLDQKTVDELRDWLTTVKKDEPDDDYSDHFESSHRVHSNLEAYCQKYKTNYNLYCSDPTGGGLEGVLTQFCQNYKDSCVEETMNDRNSITSGALQSKNQKAENGGKRLFSGTTDEYCKQFESTFQKICQGGILRSQKDTINFCTSFDQNCHSTSEEQVEPQTTNKMKNLKETMRPFSKEALPTDMSNKDKESLQLASETQKSELPDSLEDIDDIDDILLEDGEKKKSKMSEYCEKYSENYNYFCAGEEEINEHRDFCESFRKNCPDKVGS